MHSSHAGEGQQEVESNDQTTSETQQREQDDAPASNSPMSKNQMKKLARKQRILERRPEKRRIEREKNRHKRHEAAALRRAQEANGETVQVEEKPKRKFMSESSNKFRVVIDMDFEGLMTDDEIAKAAKQVGRTYSLNRHAENPWYTSWDINISERDYLDIFAEEVSNDGAKEAACDKVRDNIIYLTGDTDELLPSVDELLKGESTIFVIGGLVDHNRHKNLCYNRAQERHIRTAKLPIRENLRMGHRHILSTVTVFEIMLNVLSSRKCWRDALLASIPRRKIHPSEFEQEALEDETNHGETPTLANVLEDKADHGEEKDEAPTNPTQQTTASITSSEL